MDNTTDADDKQNMLQTPGEPKILFLYKLLETHIKFCLQKVYENKDISCKNTTYSKYDAKYLH
jgi:hypothetical protein